MPSRPGSRRAAARSAASSRDHGRAEHTATSSPCRAPVAVHRPKRRDHHRTGSDSRPREPQRVVAHLARGLQRDEHRAVEQEQPAGGQPAEQRVRVEHVGERQVHCLFASTGSPRTRIANATPHRIAGSHEPSGDADVGPASATAGRRSCRATRSRTMRRIIAEQDRQQRQVQRRRTRWRTSRGTRRTSRRRR